MRTITFILLSWWLNGHLQAQSGQGTVRYLINPADLIQEKLDGKLQVRSGTRALDAGSHRFTFYATGFQLLDTVVMVQPDATLDLRYVLKPDPEHVAFRKAQKKRQNARLLGVYTPGLLTLAGSVWVANAMKKESEAYDALKASEAEYTTLNSPSQVQALKNEVIPSQQEALKDAQRTLLTASIATGFMAGLTVWGIIRSGRNAAPVYEDKQRIRFEGIAWLPTSSGGTLFTSLTIPIR